MTENSAIFNARHGAGSFHPHRQLAPTAQDCLKRGNGANWRTTRQLSGECRPKFLRAAGTPFAKTSNVPHSLAFFGGNELRFEITLRRFSGSSIQYRPRAALPLRYPYLNL
jgi:hypothetical protein